MSLTYLPRSAWNARPSLGPVHLNATGVRGTGLHYPAMGRRHLFARDDVAHALRGWQDYHMDDREWSDIGYQVAVDQAGRVWTLRGLTTRSGANGNEEANEAYGAILLVVGDDETPTGALITSTRQVIADFRRLYPKATAIRPHSAIRVEFTGNSTGCPGNRVRGLIAAGQFEPKPVTPEGDSEMNTADREYVDDRLQAYSLWLNLRRLEDDLAVARAKNDTVAAGILAPIAARAKADWEKAAKS